MRKTKVIILDFDGVIVESVDIKDQAFRELYQGFPEHIDEIMTYHLAHNATIRFEKFRYISENILQQPYSQNDKDDLSRRFSDLVFQKIVASPFVRGAMAFLEHFHNKIPLYLVSMSPEDELLKILQQRNLLAFFTRVYAANWKKTAAIGDILEQEAITVGQAVFIGDSPEDLQAADKTGVRFIGRDSGKVFPRSNVVVKKDMQEVLDVLSENLLTK